MVFSRRFPGLVALAFAAASGIALAQIAPYAGLVHAKTHDFDEHGQPRHLDVVRALRVVRDAGYTGTISIEYEGNHGDAWENTRHTRALVQQAFG